MKSQRLAALSLLLAVPASVAAADEFRLPSRVEAVTVFPDGASVTRRLVVEVPAGDHVLILDDLPLAADAGSLRVAGAGTVERYGKGFRYRVQLGADPGTGKRRWATKGGFATEKEATKAMHRVIVAADDGLVVKRSTLRLGQYLTEWLERVTPDLKATTAAGYGRAVTKLDDKLGQVRVQDLTPLQIEQVYVGLVKDGLAPKTVRNLHSVLRRALADAERLGLVIRNAAAAARPPSVPHHEQRTWSATELNTFLATVSDHRLLASFVVFATTGMRRGEVLGL